METLAQDEDLARLIYRAEQSFDELDDFDKWRISKYLDGYVSMSEQDYLVMSAVEGFQGATAFLNDWRENMDLQMYRSYWAHSRDRYTPEFQDLINDILAELDGHQ